MCQGFSLLEWLLVIYTKGYTGQPNYGLDPYSKEIKNEHNQ